MSLLNNVSFRLLERSLDAAALRQKVIANNIANVDTPFFKRSEVSFEELLDKEMGNGKSIHGFRTDARHFYIGSHNSHPNPVVATDKHSVMNNNLNNVDIDFEMASMAQNQLRYNVMIQELNSEIKRQRIALDGRR